MNKKLLILIAVILSACSTKTVQKDGKDSAPRYIPVDIMSVPDAIPKYEKRTRAGNPIEYMISGKRYKVLTTSQGYKETGIASWYGAKFHGRTTSNGEIYDMYAMTAAHKTLPIPSYVRVTNLKNRRSVVVRINDRGPFHDNRIIDLSYTAAVKLDIQKSGTGMVEVVGIEHGVSEDKPVKKYQAVQELKKQSNYLQVGAFSSIENALDLKQRLISGQLEESNIRIVFKKADDLYKVYLGPLNSQRQTIDLQYKLLRLGMKDARLIAENNEVEINPVP